MTTAMRRPGDFRKSWDSVDIIRIFHDRSYRGKIHNLAKDGICWLWLVESARFAEGDFVSDYHVHRDCAELIFCQQGQQVYESDGQKYQLMPGSVFVSRPDEPHRQLSRTRGNRIITLHVSMRTSDWRASGFTLSDSRWMIARLKALPRHVSADRIVSANFTALVSGVNGSGGCSSERRIRVLSSALSLLLNLFDSARQVRSARGSIRLEAAAAEMRKHPERDFPNDLLSERLAMSPSQVLRAFRLHTGYTPHVYLLHCRISRAQELMREGVAITDVAQQLRFSSRQHFSLQFRRLVGASPAKWMRGVYKK